MKIFFSETSTSEWLAAGLFLFRVRICDLSELWCAVVVLSSRITGAVLKFLVSQACILFVLACGYAVISNAFAWDICQNDVLAKEARFKFLVLDHRGSEVD